MCYIPKVNTSITLTVLITHHTTIQCVLSERTTGLCSAVCNGHVLHTIYYAILGVRHLQIELRFVSKHSLNSCDGSEHIFEQEEDPKAVNVLGDLIHLVSGRHAIRPSIVSAVV